MRKAKPSFVSAILLVVLLLQAACTSVATPAEKTQPPADLPPTQSPQDTQAPAQPEVLPSPTVQVFLPEVQGGGQDTPAPVAPTAEPVEPAIPPSQLAYLKNNNLWLASLPGGVPVQLTTSNDLLSFAWSPDGTMLAYYNGRGLCAVQPDGAQVGTCIDLELSEDQALIERRIVWSPDGRTLVLWNAGSAWDEDAIGWIIVYRDGSKTILKITDPVDWGLSAAPNNEPGGVTGQAVFLADGALLGTLSHRWLCGAGGCQYQLYRFDLAAKMFFPYPNKPEEGWSEGPGLLLSHDRRALVNFGNFNAACDTASAFIDLYDLATGARQLVSLNLEALEGLALSPDSSQMILARQSACSSQAQSWDRSCGLSQGYDTLPMQRLDIASGQKSDLLPGVAPVWSPDGRWIAFRSCLALNASGGWEASATTLPSIYMMAPDGSALQLISDGYAPAWKP